MNASKCLGLWLKDHPRANLAHRVQFFDKDKLICHCGKNFPADQAASAASGTLLCQDCHRLWQQQLAQKAQVNSRKNGVLRHVTAHQSDGK
jgi:ectoine hydroxylase-related dioxygenase (phytanoyl-CoA dioxygenase family)